MYKTLPKPAPCCGSCCKVHRCCASSCSRLTEETKRKSKGFLGTLRKKLSSSKNSENEASRCSPAQCSRPCPRSRSLERSRPSWTWRAAEHPKSMQLQHKRRPSRDYENDTDGDTDEEIDEGHPDGYGHATAPPVLGIKTPEAKDDSWSLSKELAQLARHGWYWGPINRAEAEQRLSDQPDGAFLVRDSSDDRYLLSLSFRSFGQTLHTRIEHCNGVFSFYSQPDTEGFSSIISLINHSINNSQTGVFCYSRARLPGAPSFPVRLTKPVSRFSQVPTLQYQCRFVIRQYTRLDHIVKLPLPRSIKVWLEQNQYTP